MLLERGQEERQHGHEADDRSSVLNASGIMVSASMVRIAPADEQGEAADKAPERRLEHGNRRRDVSPAASARVLDRAAGAALADEAVGLDRLRRLGVVRLRLQPSDHG